MGTGGGPVAIGFRRAVHTQEHQGRFEDIGPRLDGWPDLEFRAATKALELEGSALSYQRVPPGYRFPYGHTHTTKTEASSGVLRGSGRMKVDDEIVELKEWDVVRGSSPVRGKATTPGRRASRSYVMGAPNISARIRARTSMASATGWLTSRSSSGDSADEHG